MSHAHGPLPQWDIIGGYGSGTYEAEGSNGIVWRLWLVERPVDGDPLAPGYRLAPRDNLISATFISGEHGLYHALDQAGMRIAADAVRADPDGALRQLGLDGQ
ncbi:hypothetical protein [Streptomyces botrytidirepellens]|uniref:Uncharacterized protein n=1 Tax=Streptomyces botrytidirepellens TaxID=2486417 RepID=A0A3M8W9N2_9ACTN|nr:hypothetical protein [Streptomyces botrytidirepellens]RNG26247.1 hypothetical protein EEJ42_15730 [Streptomyces botrytidirepellens]